jgi:hypothetical protein
MKDASKIATETARATLGDLSSATVVQLVTLYDTCENASEAWLDAINKPRSCYEGDE